MEAATKPVLTPGEIADTVDALIDALAEARDATVRDRVGTGRCLDGLAPGPQADEHRALCERLGRRARRLSHAITQLEDGVLWVRYAVREDHDPVAEAEQIMHEATTLPAEAPRWVIRVETEDGRSGCDLAMAANDTAGAVRHYAVRELITDHAAAVAERYELIHRGTTLDPAEDLSTLGVLAPDRQPLILRRAAQ